MTSKQFVNEVIVHNFIAHTLNIPDWKLKFEENRRNFLNELIFAHASCVYYQNVSFGAIPKPARDIPTIGEMIRFGVGGKGGTCIHLTYFLKLILEFLNYDVFIVGCENEKWPTASPRSHMAIILRFPDDKPEALYFIDAGCAGRPFLELIPLHRLPYLRKLGGFTHEFRFNEKEGTYEKFLHDGCPFFGTREGCSRSVDFHFNLTPLEFDDFAKCYEDLFSPRSNSVYMDVLLLATVTKAHSPTDFEYVTFRSKVMVEGTRDTYKETTFGSYEEMLPFIKKYFPKLDWNELTSAIHIYNEISKARGGKDSASEMLGTVTQ